MIISHKHKFIFLKTHKTGGTSLQITLSRHCGDKDVISKIHEDDIPILRKAGGKDQQNAEVPLRRYNGRDWFQYLLRGRKQYFSEHLDASYIKRWIGTDIWDSYYKFCFERDPFDKVLSYYYWRTRNENCSIEDFLDENLNSLSDYNIYGNGDKILVDDVFLYENLDASLQVLEERLKLKIDISNVRAKANHRPKKSMRNDELTSKQKMEIAKAFEREIKLFYPINEQV